MPTPLETLTEMSKDAIESIAETFEEPDADWLPTMLVMTREETFNLVGIDPEFMASPTTKAILAEQVIPGVLREQNAIAAAFVSSAWMGTYDNTKMGIGDKHLRPSQQPDRQEVVMLTLATALEAKSLTAPIIRHEDGPPTLGEWDGFDNPEGLFPEALRAGLAPQG
jgi:hypothetical protein